MRCVYQCLGLLGYPLAMLGLLVLVNVGGLCAWACQALAVAEGRVEAYMAACGAVTLGAMAWVAWRLLV
jgi:hypothetical protein